MNFTPARNAKYPPYVLFSSERGFDYSVKNNTVYNSNLSIAPNEDYIIIHCSQCDRIYKLVHSIEDGNKFDEEVDNLLNANDIYDTKNPLIFRKVCCQAIENLKLLPSVFTLEEEVVGDETVKKCICPICQKKNLKKEV